MEAPTRKTCDQCGGDLPRSRNRFCCQECSTDWEKKKRLDKFLLRELCCTNCGTLLTYSDRLKKFCNRSCAASHNNSKRGRKIVKLKTERQKRVIKPCPVCSTPVLHRDRVHCSVACHKKSAQKRAIEAIGTGRGKRGRYRGIDCQSSYELAFVIWHLDRGYRIERSTLVIPYQWGGKHRKYRPDFVIGRVTYEIKGYMDKLSKAKFRAAQNAGIGIEIVGRKDIQPYIEYVCLRYGKTPTTIHELYDETGTGGTIRTCAA